MGMTQMTIYHLIIKLYYIVIHWYECIIKVFMNIFCYEINVSNDFASRSRVILFLSL